MKKLIAVLAIFTMIAAACGDDGEVTAEEADAALDQIEGEPEPDPAPEPEPPQDDFEDASIPFKQEVA